MTPGGDYAMILQKALAKAVATDLERKRHRGEYAVFWRNDGIVFVGPDAPAVAYAIDASPARAVAEPKVK